MKYLNLLIIGIALSATLLSCSEESVESLFDDKYDQVLYIKDSGSKNITLYVSGQDTTYSFRVCKGGVQATREAHATLALRSQDEINEEYAGDNTTYRILPDSCYKLWSDQIDLSANEEGKLVSVRLYLDIINNLVKEDETIKWLLPLQLKSSSDSVNSKHNDYTLIIDKVATPQICFKNAGVAALTQNFNKPLTLKVPIGIDGMENQWDVEATIGVDKQYLADYNKTNGTNYQLPATYDVSENVNLKANSQEATVTADISSFGSQTSGYVLLPLVIQKTNILSVSKEKSHYAALIKLIGTQFDRTGWSATACSQQAQQGSEPDGSAMNAIDGNLNTRWHYKWNTEGTGSCASHPNKRHWLMLDTKKVHTLTQIGLWQRNDMGWIGQLVQKVKVYVSSDPSVWGNEFRSSDQRWKSLGEYTLDLVNDRELIFDLPQTDARYVTIEVTKGAMD